MEEDEELLRVVDGPVQLLLQVADLRGLLLCMFVFGVDGVVDGEAIVNTRPPLTGWAAKTPTDLGVGDEKHHVRHARGHQVPGHVPLPVRLVQHNL